MWSVKKLASSCVDFGVPYWASDSLQVAMDGQVSMPALGHCVEGVAAAMER